LNQIKPYQSIELIKNQLKSIMKYASSHQSNECNKSVPIPNAALAKATGCSVGSLRKIVKKGEGAFYSSGSRPNQTPQSWGYARLASAITGGKAAAVDYTILQNGCKPNSGALRRANASRKKHDKGQGTARKISI
jgi:hypothetical protein